jgi:formiminotetrahydrofolate cyclodeaminase
VPEAPAYFDTSLGELCERLAAESAPGAGSAAAVVAAMAASLTAKVAGRSRGTWTEAPGVLAQAGALATRCAELARLDAEAFGTALAALEEGVAVEGPLERAAAVLLEIGEVAADVAVLAARAAEHGDGTFRGDAASAAALAEAAARASEALIATNLTVAETDERLARARSLTGVAADAARRALSAGP